MYICNLQNLLVKEVQHMNYKSLINSLSLISRLLGRAMKFTDTQLVFLDNQQTYIYRYNEITAINFNHDESILSESLNEEEVNQSNNHPFKGLPSEIKSYTSAPLISSTKNTLGFLILLDINERTLSDEDISYIEDFAKVIADTIEKHQGSQKLQQVFTDYMHKAIHDLKNPLTSISLTSELLRRKAEDPKMVLSFCERLEKANQRLFSNLEKLKSSFPIGDNSFKLVINEINVDELLSDVKSTVNKININTENKIEKNIYADYNRLKDAIILLIGNIHSAENTDITVKSYPKEKQAIIDISSPKGSFDNYDTYLNISKTLIEMHGGRIETTKNAFLIHLPSDNL